MADLGAAARCPVLAGACPAMPPCRADLPADGAERAAILVLRFVAAARDTGDACCWDAAFDHAEAAFGEGLAPLVVGRAGALVRRLARTRVDTVFLPPPCRRLSSGEALLLQALHASLEDPARFDGDPASEPHAALAYSIAETMRPSGRRAA